MPDQTGDKKPTARQAKRDAMQIEPAIKEEWAKFPDLPGTHLKLHRVGRRAWQLVTSEGSVWATCDGPSFTAMNSAIHAAGRTFRWQPANRGPKRDAVLKATLGSVTYRADDSRDLVDTATNYCVLRVTGHHFKRSANTYVTLANDSTIQLPVRGWNPKNAMMSAVSDNGTSLVEYRQNYSRNSRLYVNHNDVVDIAVTSAGESLLTIELVVAATYGCLPSYFDTGGTF